MYIIEEKNTSYIPIMQVVFNENNYPLSTNISLSDLPRASSTIYEVLSCYSLIPKLEIFGIPSLI